MTDKTTNFDEWLDAVDPSLPSDTYALHEAIDGETSFAQFEAKRASNGVVVVHCDGLALDLLLVSDHAKATILNLICARYVEAGMSIHSWYGMHKMMESDD